MSVMITVDADAPAGVYTLYGQRADGSRTAIVGGLVVSK